MNNASPQLKDPMTFEEFSEWADGNGFIQKDATKQLEGCWKHFEKSEYLRRVLSTVTENEKFLLVYQNSDSFVPRRYASRHHLIIETFWRLLLQFGAEDRIRSRMAKSEGVNWATTRHDEYDEPFIKDLYDHTGGMSLEARKVLREFINHNRRENMVLYPFTRNVCEIFPLMLMKLYDESIVVDAMRRWIREAQSFEMDTFVRIVEQWYDVKDMEFSWIVESVREHVEDLPNTRRRRTR